MARIDFRKRSVWIPGLIALALLGLVVLRVIQASTPGEEVATVEQIRQERGVPVTVAAVQGGEMVVWREFSGTVSGTREAVVRARSGDQIASVPVEVGARVRQGQVLVRQAGEGAGARARQAEAARRQAQRAVERLRPLHEAGAISDQEWENALTQAELASADVAAAQDMLTLTSPLAGTVTEVVARPGMIPSTGDPLVRVADLSQLVVYLQVSAAEARDIREGQPARLVTGGVQGQVRRIALQADPATRQVEVEVAFPPAAGLIPGTLATVEVQVASRDNTVQVPRGSVSDGSVWVVGEDSRAVRRPVQVGLQSTDRVEVTNGLQPGERVVVEGGSLLSDGTLVRVVNGSIAGS
jgi:membrane fusion protein, multidrug efflux system